MRGALLAAAAGLVYYLGVALPSWWPLTFLGATLLIGLLDASDSPRQAVLLAAAWRIVSLTPALAYLSGVGLTVHAAAVGIHAACSVLMAWAYWHVRQRAGRPAGLLALPALWTLAEWAGVSVHFLPSHVTTWSQALGEPGILFAPFTGAYGLSTVATAAAAAPVLAACAQRRPLHWFFLLVYFIPPAAARLVYGPAPAPSGPPLRVSAFALEANDSMERYLEDGEWTPERARDVEAYARRRTARFLELLRGQSPDLVVLPEDALQLTLARSRSPEAFERLGIENNGILVDAYRALAREARADLAVGLTTIRQGRRYNSTLLIGEDGSLLGLRDKWKLTPGSEYWPFGAPLWLLLSGEQFIDPRYQYSRPERPFPPLESNGWRLGASTCLEGHMPAMYLGWRRAGAELVLFLGNAHWFRRAPEAYNQQLLRTVRLSAAAFGLPIVMTGKANHAGAIEPDGTCQVRPWVQDGGVEAAHEFLVRRAPSTPTAAARWGEYYLLLSALLVPLFLLAARRPARRIARL